MMADVWTVFAPEVDENGMYGLRRIEYSSGGPVVHYIDASVQPVEVVIESDHVAALAALIDDQVTELAERDARIIAMQQVLDQWTNRENVQRLIELAQEANALMFDNGEEAERKRVVEIVKDYYKVAPKAAETLLSRINGEA